MPIGERVIYILGGLVVVAIFAVIVWVFAKKGKAKTEEWVNALTEEQKALMINTPMKEVNDKKGSVIVKGYVSVIRKRGKSKSDLGVLFYNTYFPNMLNQFSSADMWESNEELDSHQIKEGSIVDLKINPDGGHIVF